MFLYQPESNGRTDATYVPKGTIGMHWAPVRDFVPPLAVRVITEICLRHRLLLYPTHS